MQRAEMRDDRRQQLCTIGRASDVGCPVLGPPTQGRQLLDDIRDRFARAETAERERPSLARERACDAEADAARAAGDQRNSFGCRHPLYVAGPHPRQLYFAT
jgi:hypothetical protein